MGGRGGLCDRKEKFVLMELALGYINPLSVVLPLSLRSGMLVFISM